MVVAAMRWHFAKSFWRLDRPRASIVHRLVPPGLQRSAGTSLALARQWNVCCRRSCPWEGLCGDPPTLCVMPIGLPPSLCRASRPTCCCSFFLSCCQVATVSGSQSRSNGRGGNISPYPSLVCTFNPSTDMAHDDVGILFILESGQVKMYSHMSYLKTDC